MVTISNNTIRANVFETIYDLLTAYGDWVVRPTIVAAYIDNETKDPQVVISPVRIGSDNPTFNNHSSFKNVTVVIDIYSKKNKSLDQVTDDVNLILNDNKISGLKLVTIDESFAMPFTNNNKLRNKTLSVGYVRR